MTAVDPVVADALDRASDGLLTLCQANDLIANFTGGLDPASFDHEHVEALRAAVCFEIDSKGRFHGYFAGAGPVPWPRVPEEVSSDAQAIWLAYAQHARSPAVRAHLYDLLKSAGASPAYKHARAAISAYLEAVPVYLAAGDVVRGQLYAARSLIRALGLASEMNQRDLRKTVTDEIAAIAGGLLAAESFPFGPLVQLLEALSERQLEIDAVRDLAERAIKTCPHFINQIQLLGLLRTTYSDPVAQKEIDRRIVNAMTTHAETRPGAEGLMWLNDAATTARNAGLTDMYQSAIQTMQDTPMTSLGLRRVSRPVVKVSQRDLDEALIVVDEAADLAAALWTIADTAPPTGTIAAAQQAARCLIPSVPLVASIAAGALNPVGPVPVAPASDDALANIRAEFQLSVLETSSQVIAAQLDRVRDRFDPSEADLAKVFSCPLTGSASQLSMLAQAFHYYWTGQDAAAVHLALPRVEALLREIERNCGVSVLDVAQGAKPGGMSQLGSLIHEMPAAGFNSDWHRYFDLLLTDDQRGLNLRNRLLHGLADCPPRAFIALVLHVALYLLAVAHGVIPLSAPATSSASQPSRAETAIDRPLAGSQTDWAVGEQRE